MSGYNFLPEKYWNIHDERIPILKKYLKSLNIKQLTLLPTKEIIKICIDGLKKFQLTEEESKKIKNLIIIQNGIILTPCIEKICGELSKITTNEITIISLGCGDKSLFERLLHEAIATNLPKLKINWLGTDVGDYRGTKSFFNDNPFKIIKETKNIKYISLTTKKNYPIFIIARYSFHHMGIEFEEFIKRCGGITKTILIEEPTTKEKWDIADYRFMRIAYDVLANTVFVLPWASLFIEDLELFKINYIKTDTLGNNVVLTEFKDVLPETALVIV